MQKLSQAFDKYLFWWVIGLFIFIPLYPKFPLLNVPGTYVAVRMEDFLIAVTVLWWLIVEFSNFKKTLSKTLTQAFILFWAVGFLSLISGVFLTHTAGLTVGFLNYLRRIEVMTLFFVALSAFKNISQVKTLLKIMFAVTIVIVAYGFGQQWLSFPVISTTNREFSKGLILFLTPGARVNSTFAGHYDLATYLAFFLAVSAVLFFYTKNFFEKAGIVLAGFFEFILLTLTAARVSFVAAILAIMVGFILIGKKLMVLLAVGLVLLGLVVSSDLRHRIVATITVNLLNGGGPKYVAPSPIASANPHKFSLENAGTAAATLSGTPIDVAPGEPINPTELGVERSFGIRTEVEWPRAIRALAKNPLLGTGYSSITLATDNDYLRSLGETGLLGTAALALVFIIIIKKLWWSIGKRDFKGYLVTAILCGLLTFFITASFIDVLESSKVAELLWLTLGMSVALVKMEPKDG